MGRGDDEAPGVPMRLHEPVQDRLGGIVEGGERLVEEPDRAIGDEETRERHPPPLAGRQVPDRQAGRVREPQGREGVAGRQAVVPVEALREDEVLLGRQGALQGVAMADGMQAFREGPVVGLRLVRTHARRLPRTR